MAAEREMTQAAHFVPSLSSAGPTEGGGRSDAPSAAAAPAVRALVEAHADFVWRSLRRLGVPESLADDATQQVFLVAARRLRVVTPGGERAFLFRTLSHVAAHVRRSLARRREEPYSEACEPVDTAPPADQVAADRQARAMLDAVLDALPAELRTVFVLFELEELSGPEIAALTGLPAGTVASRLRRAREEFRKAARRVRAHGTRAPGGAS